MRRRKRILGAGAAFVAAVTIAITAPVVGPVAPAGAAASSVAPFRSADAFVRQQFTDFQGRAATSAELTSASSKLTAGSRTAAQTVDAVAHLGTAPERTGNVARLYTAYFQRLPDIGGLEYWVGKSAAGMSLNTISATFAGSSEFKRKYGSLSSAGFVDLAYQNVFGRPADPSGRAYWIKKLNAGTSRGVVMVSYSTSGEYQRKQATTVEMVVAYRGLLRRIPTGTEATDAVARVQADGFAALAGDLLALPAYAARFPAPGTPTSFTAEAGDAKAILRWHAPTTNGPALTGYTLRVTKGGVQQGADRAIAASALTTTVTGLTNNQAYSFALFASNANRDGAAANVGPITVKGEVVWSTYRGDAAHTGVQPNGVVPASPTLKWEHKFPGPVRQVVVGDGRIYALAWAVPAGASSSTLSLVALNPVTGTTVWGPIAIGEDSYSAGMTYENGRLFVADQQEILRAFNSDTGALLWSTKVWSFDMSEHGPTVYGGRIYVWAEDGLMAIDTATGDTVWSGKPTSNTYGATPAVDASGIYTADGCGFNYRMNFSGQRVWTTNGICGGGASGVAVLSGGRMWTNGDAEFDTILDQANGAKKGTPIGTMPPAVTGATALYNDADMTDRVPALRAVDWATGTERWNKTGDGYLSTSPVVNEGRAFIASSEGMAYGYAVADGTQTWSRDVVGDMDLTGIQDGDRRDALIGDLAIGDGLLLFTVSDDFFQEFGSVVAYG